MVVNLVFTILLLGGPAALLILIYRSKNAVLTTHHYHKKASWVDKLPTPVMALWVFFVTTLVCLLPFLFCIDFIQEVDGLLLSATISKSIFVGLIVVYALLAFGIARLAPWAWWLAMVFFCACGLVAMYFYSSFDAGSLMGNASEKAKTDELLSSMNEYQQQTISSALITGVIFWMGILTLLCLIRKHFFKTKEL